MVSGVRWEDRALITQLTTFNSRADRAITAVMAFHSKKAVAYARQNAPWTDRTSNARNGLFSQVERERPVYRIVLAHGVPYGIWLEVRFSGRFAIIRPTIDHQGPLVMETAAKLFQRMGMS